MAGIVEPGQQPREPAAEIDPAVAQAYWKRTSGLMWTMMTIWAFASFVVHLFAPTLNTIHVLGFPFGFYMAAQGSLIIFVVQLYWFARKQNAIDEEFGVAEE
mgnify:FL=1